MSESQGWALVSFLALGGWAATLVFLGKAILPMANALGVIFKVDDLFDKRINAVLDRYRASRAAAAPKVPEDGRVRTQPMSGFGGPSPLIPDGMSVIDEQPDANGLETEG